MDQRNAGRRRIRRGRTLGETSAMTRTTPGSGAMPPRALKGSRVGIGCSRRRGTRLGAAQVRARRLRGLPVRGRSGRTFTRQSMGLRKAQGGRRRRELGARKSTVRLLVSARNRIARQGNGSGIPRRAKNRGIRRMRRNAARLGKIGRDIILGSTVPGRCTIQVRRATMAHDGTGAKGSRTEDHGRRRSEC